MMRSITEFQSGESTQGLTHRLLCWETLPGIVPGGEEHKSKLQKKKKKKKSGKRNRPIENGIRHGRSDTGRLNVWLQHYTE